MECGFLATKPYPIFPPLLPEPIKWCTGRWCRRGRREVELPDFTPKEFCFSHWCQIKPYTHHCVCTCANVLLLKVNMWQPLFHHFFMFKNMYTSRLKKRKQTGWFYPGKACSLSFCPISFFFFRNFPLGIHTNLISLGHKQEMGVLSGDSPWALHSPQEAPVPLVPS